MDRLTIVQCFDTYLRTTENWAFRLIRNMPGCDQIIASRQFLKSGFHDPAFTYVEFPWPRIEAARSWPLRAVNALQRKASRLLYPAYLEQMLRDRGVDILHSHFAPVGWEYRKVARRLGARHVVSFYGFDYEHLPWMEPAWNRRYAELFSSADLFVCEGAHGASVLAGRGCPRDKIVVNRLGIEVEGTPFFARPKRPRELRLLQVASFTAKKGQAYTVRAFAKVAAHCPGSTLTFVGGGDAQAAVQTEAHKLGVADRVAFLAPIPFEQLHRFMKDYHVFIQPSGYTDARDCEGGAPVALIDAQATGMPVISTRHCDIPEVVVDGETGVLTDERDVEALAVAITKFYGLGEEDFARQAAAARRHIEAQYDVRKNGAQLRDVLDSLRRHRITRLRSPCTP